MLFVMQVDHQHIYETEHNEIWTIPRQSLHSLEGRVVGGGGGSCLGLGPVPP